MTCLSVISFEYHTFSERTAQTHRVVIVATPWVSTIRHPRRAVESFGRLGKESSDLIDQVAAICNNTVLAHAVTPTDAACVQFWFACVFLGISLSSDPVL